MCPVHEEEKVMNQVYAGELHRSLPLDDLQERAMQDAIDPETDRETILSS